MYTAENQVGAGGKLSSVDQEPTAFIKKYGAYLQMHTSLTYAALMNAEAVICDLLSVAEHDPSHLEAAREIRKGNTLMFYDHVSCFSLRFPVCYCKAAWTQLFLLSCLF